MMMTNRRKERQKKTVILHLYEKVEQLEETPSPLDFIATYVMASLHGDPRHDYIFTSKNIKQFEETPSPQDFIATHVMASLHGDPRDDHDIGYSGRGNDVINIIITIITISHG